MKNENQLQEAVCKYIALAYPNVLFNSDMSGIKLTKGQAIRASKLRSSRGFLDIAIYERRKGVNALFIELKIDGTKLFKKNGEYATPHINEQAIMIEKLISRGYFATFAIGFDQTKAIIDDYFS